MLKHAARRAWCGLVLVGALAGAAAGDRVIMRDGTVHEGRVIDETSGTVVFETRLHGIKTKLTLQRRDIREITFDPIEDEGGAPSPEGNASDEPAAAEDTRDRPRPAPRARDARAAGDGPADGRYMVIPVTGRIGVDVTAPGIADALDQAGKLGAAHIVFVIDSPGGFLYEALEIREVLAANRDRFTMHAYVAKQAISAATVLAAGSSTITMAPSSTIGGATAYSIRSDTGSHEVDAKINSIWSAEMASIASTSGHDEAPFRAMIEQERELYVLRGPAGATLSASPPPASDSRQWERVDDTITVLTLTARQVEDYGIGRVVEGGAPALGAALAVEGWHEAAGDGARAMEKAAKERDQLSKALDTAGAQLHDLAEDAKKHNPRRVTILYDRNTLQVTEESKREWTRACALASSAWRRVDGMMDRFTTLKKKAEEMGALHLAVPQEDIEQLRQIAREQLEWLNEYGRAPNTIADLPPDD